MSGAFCFSYRLQTDIMLIFAIFKPIICHNFARQIALIQYSGRSKQTLSLAQQIIEFDFLSLHVYYNFNIVAPREANYLHGYGGILTAAGTWTGAGLCTQELVVSGLGCDLVRRYKPSVVLFLTMYDLGYFANAALRTVPGSQVLVWCSSIRTDWPRWSGSRVGPTFRVVMVTIVALLPLQWLLSCPESAVRLSRVDIGNSVLNLLLVSSSAVDFRWWSMGVALYANSAR